MSHMSVKWKQGQDDSKSACECHHGENSILVKKLQRFANALWHWKAHCDLIWGLACWKFKIWRQCISNLKQWSTLKLVFNPLTSCSTALIQRFIFYIVIYYRSTNISYPVMKHTIYEPLIHNSNFHNFCCYIYIFYIANYMEISMKPKYSSWFIQSEA